MAGDPFADAMNAMPKFVVSTTLQSPLLWRNSMLINDNVVETIRELKQRPGKNILMDGSSVLAHTLIEHDLVDEIDLHVYPISLGSGSKLFPAGKHVGLKLVECKPLPTGVVFMQYQLSNRH